jgi:hypothetical protein
MSGVIFPTSLPLALAVLNYFPFISTAILPTRTLLPTELISVLAWRLFSMFLARLFKPLSTMNCSLTLVLVPIKGKDLLLSQGLMASLFSW